MDRADVDWMIKAACAGMNRDIFFPEYTFLTDPAAIAACQRCEVKEQCRDWAFATDQEFGIWGGLNQDQRAAVDRTRSRVKCPDCRSDRVMEDGRTEVCLSCGLSWAI
jgi:WhiB family redox-sensing transcriptional regulator